MLLGIGPCKDGTRLGTKELHNFITFTLSVYEKSWDNITAIVGDNCLVNTALPKLSNCFFVGCASHRYSLAVKDLLDGFEDEIYAVNSVMKKLKNPIPAAKLRRLTGLCAISRNVTRGSSVYAMLQRYL